MTGSLYLIPVNLADPIKPSAILPNEVISTVLRLDYFIAENAKTARAFLKAMGTSRPLNAIAIHELDKHTTTETSKQLLAPILEGHDLGLVSEAGAPAIADPGAVIVALAHEQGIPVLPQVGPSSILLGLMASGLNGQRFSFQGYLPQDKTARCKVIEELERESRQKQMTQIFIETPYRNQALFTVLIASLAPTTRLCIATDLTGQYQKIQTLSVSAWHKRNISLAKLPTIFLFLAA